MGAESERMFNEWMQTATRYAILTNAGGAVATLSFIGASVGGGGFPKFAVVPLACYALGLALAGLVIHGQLTGAYRTFIETNIDAIAAGISMDRSLVTRFGVWAEAHTGTYLLAPAFGLFVFGTLLGLIALLVW